MFFMKVKRASESWTYMNAVLGFLSFRGMLFRILPPE